jgi:hypothetical protein
VAQSLTNGAQPGFVGQPPPPAKDHYNGQCRIGISMNNIQSKMIFALVVITVIGLNSAFAQSQTSSVQTDRISITYIPPDNVQYQDVYNLLRRHGALEKIQEILSPFRSFTD